MSKGDKASKLRREINTLEQEIIKWLDENAGDSQTEIELALEDYPDYGRPRSRSLLEDCDPNGSLRQLERSYRAKVAELKRAKS
jgi:hypothetical protein